MSRRLQVLREWGERGEGEFVGGEDCGAGVAVESGIGCGADYERRVHGDGGTVGELWGGDESDSDFARSGLFQFGGEADHDFDGGCAATDAGTGGGTIAHQSGDLVARAQ